MIDYIGKTVGVDGGSYKVIETLSCGPGESPHTFVLEKGGRLYVIGDTWKWDRPGFPTADLVLYTDSCYISETNKKENYHETDKML